MVTVIIEVGGCCGVFRWIGTSFSARRGAVETCFAQMDLPEGTSISEIASVVLSVMEGAVMQSRVYRNVEPFDAGVRQLRSYLDLLRARITPESR